MKRYVLIGAVVLGVSTASLQAGQVVTVNFTGNVFLNTDHQNIFSNVSPGDPVTGTYSYDTNVSDSNPDLFVGEFATGSLTVVIGSLTFQSVSARSTVNNDNPPDRFQVISNDFTPSIPGATAISLVVGFRDNGGTALSSDALPTGAPDLSVYDDNRATVIYSDPVFTHSSIRCNITSVSLKGGGGTCSPDSDGDGIQDGVDVTPNTYTDSFIDTFTTPTTTGSFTDRGDQNLCASDEPGSQGVRVESLSGGPNPATVQLSCFGGGIDIKTKDLTSGECVICTCLSGPTAQVAWCPGSLASAGPGGPAAVALPVGAVELDLLRSGVVVATLVLPEGNSITYDPQTAEITAPASNTTTLNLVGQYGGQQPLGPGETTTVPDSAIPAASTWGLIALALTLLVGAKVYFRRRRAAAA